MVTTVFTLVTALLVCSAYASQPTPTNAPETVSDFVKIIDEIFDEDDFSEVKTKATEPETETAERTKRSVSNLLGNRAYGNGAYGSGCGASPAQRTTFVRCFSPSAVSVQRRTFVRNYYRRGNYGQCMNYFRALPLTNVATIASGYTGQLRTTTGRSYTVSACKRCYGGNAGISVRSTTRPYNRLVRQFIFSPQINNVIYNNYNSYASPNVGYNSLGLNNLGLNNVGYNNLGRNNGGLNNVGYNNGGLNNGIRYANGADYINGAGNVLNGGVAGYGYATGAAYPNGMRYGKDGGYGNDGGYVNGGVVAPGTGIGYATGVNYNNGRFGVAGDYANGYADTVNTGVVGTGVVGCTTDC